MIRLRIEASNVSAMRPKSGSVDSMDAVAGYLSTRKEAHAALDKVLDALGVEDENE